MRTLVTGGAGFIGHHHLVGRLVERGRRVEPTFPPRRPGDIVDSHPDITLASEALRFEPVVSFHEGIARTLAWYREEMIGRAAHLDRSRGPRV